jgi:hypothetical protein
MAHELKIIVGDSLADTKVFIDDKKIGMIQDIKLHIGVDTVLPEVEIVFPNLFQTNIDPTFYRTSTASADLMQTLEILKEMPHVRATLKDLDFGKK